MHQLQGVPFSCFGSDWELALEGRAEEWSPPPQLPTNTRVLTSGTGAVGLSGHDDASAGGASSGAGGQAGAAADAAAGSGEGAAAAACPLPVYRDLELFMVLRRAPAQPGAPHR